MANLIYKSAISRYNKMRQASSAFLKEPEKMAALINNATKKQAALLGPLQGMFRNFLLSLSLVKDWSQKKYTKIPIKSILSIIGALVYFLAPLDAIPDLVPFLGLVDDAFIIGITLRSLVSELREYEKWKNNATPNSFEKSVS
jgi:uncharacterized membrane protein YkvA (DUF1232 family)